MFPPVEKAYLLCSGRKSVRKNLGGRASVHATKYKKRQFEFCFSSRVCFFTHAYQKIKTTVGRLCSCILCRRRREERKLSLSPWRSPIPHMHTYPFIMDPPHHTWNHVAENHPDCALHTLQARRPLLFMDSLWWIDLSDSLELSISFRGRRRW